MENDKKTQLPDDIEQLVNQAYENSSNPRREFTPFIVWAIAVIFALISIFFIVTMSNYHITALSFLT